MIVINNKKLNIYLWFNPLDWRIHVNIFNESWHLKTFAWRVEFLFIEVRKLK